MHTHADLLLGIYVHDIVPIYINYNYIYVHYYLTNIHIVF